MKIFSTNRMNLSITRNLSSITKSYIRIRNVIYIVSSKVISNFLNTPGIHCQDPTLPCNPKVISDDLRPSCELVIKHHEILELNIWHA